MPVRSAPRQAKANVGNGRRDHARARGLEQVPCTRDSDLVQAELITGEIDVEGAATRVDSIASVASAVDDGAESTRPNAIERRSKPG